MLITRNNPSKHPMLKQILNLAIKSSLEYKVSTRFGFYITKFYDLEGSFHKMDMAIVDDPLAAIFGLFFPEYTKKICFWSFEQAEYQLNIKGAYTFVRFLLFRASYLIAFTFAKKIYFPSELRKDFALSKYYFIKSISKKNRVLYNVRMDLFEIASICKVSLTDTSKNRQDSAVYAGAIQEGRLVDSILEDSQLKGYKLKICGPISDSYKAKFLNMIKNYSNAEYLGILDADSLRELYEVSSFGYVSYLEEPLNSKYCAPVKIFEYSHYGLKILSNNNYAMVNEWSLFVDTFYGTEVILHKTNSSEEMKNFTIAAIENLEHDLKALLRV